MRCWSANPNEFKRREMSQYDESADKSSRPKTVRYPAIRHPSLLCCVRSDVVFVKVLSMSFHARFLIRPRFYKNIRLKVLGHMLGRSTVGHFWSSVKPLFPKNSHSSSSPDAHAQLGKTAW